MFCQIPTLYLNKGSKRDLVKELSKGSEKSNMIKTGWNRSKLIETG